MKKALLLIGMVLLLSCEKEELCYLCEVHELQTFIYNGIMHFGWEYIGQESFCDGIPDSAPLPDAMDEWVRDPNARKYSNCTAY